MMEASEPMVFPRMPVAASESGEAATVAAARPEAPAAATADDGALMRAIGGGDRAAFASVVERYGDSLVAYLARLTGDRDRAEDLAQETFLRLYGAAGRYRERGHLTAYLYRIATNLVRGEERRERRKRILLATFGSEPTPAPRDAGSEPDAPARLLAREAREQLAAAVADLPLAYRVPLVLAEIEGWRLADIARLLRCREGTIKSRLFRARKRLRRRLAPYWHGGNPR